MNTSKNLALIELGEPHKIMGDVFPDRPPDECSVWTCLEYVEEFCRTIAPIVNRIIVVVSPGKREVLRWLAERWRIIPGLKTNGFIGGESFANVELWRDLVCVGELAADVCKSDTVYFDNERTLRPFWENSVEYDYAAVADAVRRSVGAMPLKFLLYQPHILCDTPERQQRSTALTKAVLAGMKPEDRLAPGFVSSATQWYGRTGDREALILASARYTEQLLIRPHLHTPKSITALMPMFDKDILNFSAATGLADARELVRLQTPQQQETETMAISSRRIVGRFALGFRKMLITQPVAPAPAYLELGPVTWANNTNGGGGEPRPLRQDGNKAIARVKLPASSLPYWIIPEIGVGELYGSHALEGTNGHECQALGAPWNDGELGPLTIKKRSITEPKLIQPSETDAWTDFEVPMLGEMGPDNIFVVNLHPYQIQAS